MPAPRMPVTRRPERVARALGRTRTAGAVDSLKALAQDPIWYVRLQAIGGLAACRQPGATESIWGATRDKHWRVRQRAVAALCELSTDRPGLLRRMREEVKDRYALGALISLYERNGTVWDAISHLCSAQPELRLTSQALVQELLMAGAWTSLVYALEAHPDPCVRRETLRLIAEGSPTSAEMALQNSLASPQLDQQTRQEIQALLMRLKEGS